MICNILDWKCIVQNELIGDTTLTIFLFAIAYFYIASKSKFGFETTLFVGVISILLLSTLFGLFSPIFGFLTVIVAIFLALSFDNLTS